MHVCIRDNRDYILVIFLKKEKFGSFVSLFSSQNSFEHISSTERKVANLT